jgi:cation diffusion facilitator CzcD-associated flavoprotein CzcO
MKEKRSADQGRQLGLDIGHRRLGREVRAARSEGRPTPRVVIVGAGLSGLGIAMQLVRSGLRDFTVVEQSNGVGGTWRDNSYPGSGCDVPSHLYSFSFSPKSDWSRRYAEQPEILSYAEECVERFGIEPHLRLNTTVQRAELDETSRRWRLGLRSSNGDEEIEADVVIFACGQLNRPHRPDLAGIEQFAGPVWHSSQWNHRHPLEGQSVAVVGTGASAIQFVPPVAERAASVTIYQRTPAYVAPKRDYAYSELWRRMFDKVGAIERLYRWLIYWGLESRWLVFRKDSWPGRKLQRMFITGIRKGVVSDRLPEASVVPNYPIGCKRILISNDWYGALFRPSVEVVGQPIDHIEPDAVVTADGQRRPTDVLIFGTGFESTDFLAHIPVVGRGGRTLATEWAESAHAYLGTAVPGFPNCYLLYGPNTNLAHNSILFMVERQINLILQAIALQLRATAGPTRALVGVSPSASHRDDLRTQRLMTATVWVEGCHSWYKNKSGRVTNNWPSWTVRYWYDTLLLRTRDLGVINDQPHIEPTNATSVAPGPD